MKLSLLPMKKEDLENIINIEASAFDEPWTYTMFSEQLELPNLYTLATLSSNEEIIGYFGLLKIIDEGHITNLAVQPDLQSRGIGKTLMHVLFELARKNEINSLSLEVKTSNMKALELYKCFGFENIAIRKNYYGYEEDAFVMIADNISAPNYSDKLKEIKDELKHKIVDEYNIAS